MTVTLPTHAEFKLFTGAELEIVRIEYRDPEDGHVECDILNEHLNSTKETVTVGDRCACCNKSIKYSAGVYIKPLDFIVHIGRQCANQVAALGVLSNLKLEYLKERHVSQKLAAKFTNGIEGLAEVVEWCSTPKAHYIAKDIASKIRQWGSISEKQVELLFKLHANAMSQQSAEAEFTPTASAPEGRVTITGKILGFKEVENDYGITIKMIVRIDDTNAKAYLTLPSSIADKADRGSHVQLTASFQRSKDDQFFAFGSRPSKASILS